MNVPMRGWAINPLMGPANHTNDVSCSDNPKVNKNGVPYLQIKSVSTPVIKRHDSQKRHKCAGNAKPMKHVPELNSPSDLCTRHRDTQEYQILRRQPPLWSRVHEGLDARGGGVRPRRSSLGLRPASTVIRLEDVGAGGIPTAGWPGHLSCRVGVSVGAGRKGHGSTGLVLEFCPVCGVWEVEGEGEFGSE